MADPEPYSHPPQAVCTLTKLCLNENYLKWCLFMHVHQGTCDLLRNAVRAHTVLVVCRSGESCQPVPPAFHSCLTGGVVIPLCHSVTQSIRHLLRHVLLLLLLFTQFLPSLPPFIIILLLCMASTCSARHTPSASSQSVCGCSLPLFPPPALPCDLWCASELPCLLKGSAR